MGIIYVLVAQEPNLGSDAGTPSVFSFPLPVVLLE